MGGLNFITGSVFMKAAGLSAVTTAIVVAIMAFLSAASTTEVAKVGMRFNVTEISASEAHVLSGHVRFGNTEAIEEELDYHVERAGEHFVGIVVYDVNGDVLAQRGDMTGGLQQTLASMSAEARQSATPIVDGDGFWIARPVLFGGDGEVTGAVAVAWKPDAMLAWLAGEQRQTYAIVVGVFLLLLVVSTELTRRMIGRPLTTINASINRVAEGDYDTHVPLTNKTDEIGAIARALDAMVGRLSAARAAENEREAARAGQAAVVDRLGRGLTALAEGDLTHRIDGALGSEYEQLRADFNRAVERLSAAIGQVYSAANSIREGIGSVSASSDDLSRRTENQAATLEETAAALDELTTSVRSAADGSREVESIVTDARTHAEKSGQVVQSAVGAMTKIEKSSEQISQIIGVIDDIAFQTNLLALNAGVEAARAGEAGKGFAVVASEVRVLAQRTSDAAKEIKDLISGSSAQVGEGVHLVGKAGEALGSIVERVSHISELVTGIAAGTVEQANSLDEINTGVTSLDQVTQQNAAMVEESTAAAHTLYADADRLASLVGQFRIAQAGPGAHRAAA